MAFCPNCGNEIREGAVFCGNCGKKIEKKTTTNQPIEILKNFNSNNILCTLKQYFLNFYVDYNSKIFKFAIIVFLAVGISGPLYTMVSWFIPDINSLFSGAGTVFKFLICFILFDVFCIFILKSKSKETVKKSSFIIIFWIVAIVLNLLVFLTDMELYQYVLFSGQASVIVELLMVISSVALICKNKQKHPITLIISAISFALAKSSLWVIKFEIGFYNIYKTSDYLMNVFSAMKYIILVIALFLLVYIVPKKISKWLVYVPALAVVVLEVQELIDGFLFVDILDFIIDLGTVAVFVLFALCCSRKAEYNYVIENKEKTKKSIIKVGVISVSSLVIIVVAYLLISAIVCSAQINYGVKKWKGQVISAELNSEAQWDSMSEDIFKYSCTKFVAQFVDDYSFYETLKEERYLMEKISLCYSEYKSGYVNDETARTYTDIIIDEDWKYNSVLSPYYIKYIEMQPDIENVTVNSRVDVDNGKIEVWVKNKNKMPISKCTVKCDFTIIFIEPGSYSSNEYGRGSKNIVVENINGNTEKTQTISFNPDDYYDSYGSYIMAALMNNSTEIISIE
ncbi:MAG: zinc ribbon domain-containing protein [Clostridia bacterium]|nr:zinc ribbon domain-containing protein [Clostridia bacterium]